MAVGLFGAGDFAHTLLILLATQELTPTLGVSKAASVAISLYVAHNVLYALSAFISGWVADRYDKRRVLATGYGLAAAMALCALWLPLGIPVLALIFILGGTYVGIEETLEDSLCAELVEEEQQGMAFGTLATVNGVGDFVSSLIVGLLWSGFGIAAAMGYSAALFASGALFVTGR
jgi:MFS family permease